MKILITGGCGFLGSNLAFFLSKIKIKFLLLTRLRGMEPWLILTG